MDLATGAMGSLLPKLIELLKDEYKLQKGVKEGIKSLEKEMKSMQAALRKVAEVPRGQLDEQVKLWAGEVRELSFDMEDIVDKFLVHVDDESETATKSNRLKRLTEKMSGLFSKGKARHEIADAIKDINKQVQEVANRRERYNIDDIVPKPVAGSTIDPRLGVMYKEVTELVGIAGKRDRELMMLLSAGDSESKNELKTVSVVGFGGLGKTTLVKMVYDKIKGDFHCNAFVPVGRNADAKKVLFDILIDLEMYRSEELAVLDERQLINKLRKSLETKRYLIVIDDIWDGNLWSVINLAFPNGNDLGSRLITTTRIVSVSKICCRSTNHSVYQMEPLSDDDSKRLFYKRIFSNKSECPHEFEDVSICILRKCGGVPLAITTIASLLVSNQEVKTLAEWNVLLESIGRGLTEDPSVEEMLRILSFSYYDLPSHLKTCLLYLSMFPEDHKIQKDQLIWMWIAENFVHTEKSKTSLFEIGEAYFNDLVNRNMIMPVYDYDGVLVTACRVHDMVLDLITSFSGEDNFVAVLNGVGDSMSSQSNVRRLSLQDAIKGEHENFQMFKLRSVVAFGSGIDLMPSFLSFAVLRVLNLTGCCLGDHNHLKLADLGSLLHLRYLGLGNTGISKVPEEIGKLQFLQVLDLSENRSVELPPTISKLRRLMCLLLRSEYNMPPDCLRNMAYMEVLSFIWCDFLSIVKDIGCMRKLRELNIFFRSCSLEMEEAFEESLGKLSNIQILSVMSSKHSMGLLERWVPPPSLKEFHAKGFITFSTLPAWIRRDPSLLLQLSVLHLYLEEVRREHLDILGRLLALRSLDLNSHHQSELLVVGADGFPCLTYLHLPVPGQVVFQPGAMPKAEILLLSVDVSITIEEAVGKGGDYSGLGLENLMSLRKVQIDFNHDGATIEEVKQAHAAVVSSLRVHPNHPKFYIGFHPHIPERDCDEDIHNYK